MANLIRMGAASIMVAIMVGWVVISSVWWALNDRSTDIAAPDSVGTTAIGR